MKKTNRIAVFLSIVLVSSSQSGHTAGIFQDLFGGTTFFAANGGAPSGQTFVVPDQTPIQSFGIGLIDGNQILGDLAFTLTLFEGVGFGGPVVVQVSEVFASLPLETDLPLQRRWQIYDQPFAEFRVGSLPLVVGQTYTISVRSNSRRGGWPSIGQDVLGFDAYPQGGHYSSIVGLRPNFDHVFSVNAVIPEPLTATLGLMGLGVLGMATRRRPWPSQSRVSR